MEREIIKIGSVELYEDEARKLFEEKKYIVTYGGVYQLSTQTYKRKYMDRRLLTKEELQEKADSTQ